MLKIKFWRIENIIIMKILEQGDEIKRGCGTVCIHHDLEIRSESTPQLFANTILIQGKNRKADNKCESIILDSAEQAKSLLLKYIDTVKAYNKKLVLSDKQFEIDDIEEVIAE